MMCFLGVDFKAKAFFVYKPQVLLSNLFYGFIASTKKVMFSVCPFAGNITEKLLAQFPWNWVEGYMGQEIIH